ncbi:MAG: hypothetical protein WC551_01055 [Patescibacteria group bacterium]
MISDRDIDYLRRLANATDNENSGHLERIVRMLDLIQGSPDSPSEQAQRAETAAQELRALQGLDDDAHNEVCFIAERLDAAHRDFVDMSNAVGY